MPTSRRRSRSRKSPPSPSRLRRLFGALLILFAITGLVGSLATVGVLQLYAADLPSLDALQEANLAQATRILDRNGNLIDVLYHENRTVVPLAKISPNLRSATIATEDRQFYQHQGVDYRRLAIAGIYDLAHRSQAYGGSTITEQVIKNTLLKDTAQDKSVNRKIKELMLAEEMERRYSKDQILQLYLNTINYGNGAFGAQAAAQTYFGVDASQLSPAQASFLAGLPQLPNRYNPLGTPEQQDAARARWREVVDSILAAGYIKAADADAIMATDLFKQIAAHHAAVASGRDGRTAHFVDYVLQYLEQRYPQAQLYEGGLTVTTSLDLPTQLYADQMVKQGVATYKSKGANTGALLAMDPHDGEIVAMVGSADYFNEDIRGQVNLTGVDPTGYRPVGSSFKAYTYAAALQTGVFTAATKVDDQNPVIDGHRYSDWDGKTEGMIPLRQAFQESRNLPALETYKSVGGSSVLALARQLGITTPIESVASLPTTLGTNAMSMLEHLAAYSAFDNGGFKITAHPVLKVTDAHGSVLEAFDGKASTQRVMSPELAYLETDILRGPPRLYLGYGTAAPVAAKSGTTESWTGAYWIGYTPDIAVATYMAHINSGDQCTSGFAGLASGFQASGWLCPTNVLWGEHVGLSVWKPFLDGYYSHKSWPQPWSQPSGIVKEAVCRADGSKAAPTTPADQAYQEIFMAGVGEPVDGQCAAAARPAEAPSPSPSPSPSPGRPPSPSPPASH